MSKQVPEENKMFSLTLSKQVKWLQLVHIHQEEGRGKRKESGRNG